MGRILVFGDSIAYGHNDPEGGWADRLKRDFLERKYSVPDFDWSVYNQGVSGAYSSDIIDNIEGEAKARIKTSEKSIIVFAIGVNDTQFYGDKNEYHISAEGFKKNIQKLTDLAKKYADTVVFVGITPCVEERVSPIPWRTEVHYSNERIQKFENIISETCKENEVSFLPLFESIKKMDYAKIFEDGLHPDPVGHQMIYEMIRGFILENKMLE